MHKAIRNFWSGKGMNFKVGDAVSCDEETAKMLLAKGLIEVVPDSEIPPAQKGSVRGVVTQTEPEESPSPEESQSKKGRKRKG